MESTRFAWLEAYLIMLGVGAVLAISLLLISRPRLLRIVGTWPFCTPNWQTIWGVVITVPGLIIFFNADGRPALLWAGLIITIVGRILDRTDGKTVKVLLKRLRFLAEIWLVEPSGKRKPSYPDVQGANVTKSGMLYAWFQTEEIIARKKKVRVWKRVYIEEWLYFLTSPGTRLPMFRLEQSDNPQRPGLLLKLTGLGACMDPIGDKLCFLPFLIHLAIQNWVYPWLAVLMVVSDLFSTFMRWPFDKLPVFRLLQRWVVAEDASAVGKTKFLWQTLTFVAVMPAAAGWLQPAEQAWSRHIVSVLLGLGVLTGMLSNLSRTAIWQGLIRALGLVKLNKNLGRLYEHDVE